MNSPIILSLNHNLADADVLVKQTRPHIGMIKIGLSMWAEHGSECLSLAKNYNISVLLDLKLHDIPDVVARTTDKLCSHLSVIKGNHFLSVHCFGGPLMCNAAKQVAEHSNTNIVGVTLLTSLDETDIGKFGYRDRRPGPKTVDLAFVGKNIPHELNHFMCAPVNVPLLRQYLENDVIITSGIRAETDDLGSHKRTKPMSFALKSGANWVVIGRPITTAFDPSVAAEEFKIKAEKYII